MTQACLRMGWSRTLAVLPFGGELLPNLVVILPSAATEVPARKEGGGPSSVPSPGSPCCSSGDGRPSSPGRGRALSPYSDPPFGLAKAGTTEAAQSDAVLILPLDAATRGPCTPSSLAVGTSLPAGRSRPYQPCLQALLGDRVDGPLGKTIDVMSVLAVLFGVAVSLGSAGLQLTAGLGETFGTPTGIVVQLLVIGITTIAFMISASTAVEKGINYLSQISMYVAAVLLVFFLVMGPTALQLGP